MRLLYRVKYLLWATSSCVISKLYSWSLPSSSMQMTLSEVIIPLGSNHILA